MEQVGRIKKGTYREVEGDLIKLALEGRYDAITHGCNCFCIMGAGIAPQMAEAFKCHEYPLEHPPYRGDMNKLGVIEWKDFGLVGGKLVNDKKVSVINSYTQYGFGKNHLEGNEQPLDYAALTLCMRKINHYFKEKYIGLPQIGAGLAGGDWNLIKTIIQRELKDCYVEVVIYKP